MRIYVLVRHGHYDRVDFSIGYNQGNGNLLSQSDSHYQSPFTDFGQFINNAFNRWVSASHFPRQNIVYLQTNEKNTPTPESNILSNQAQAVCYISGDLSYEEFKKLWEANSMSSMQGFYLKNGVEEAKYIEQREAAIEAGQKKIEEEGRAEEEAKQKEIKNAHIVHHTVFTSSKIIEFLVNPNNYFLLALAMLVVAILLPEVVVGAIIAAGVFSGLGILSLVPFIWRDFLVERKAIYDRVYDENGEPMKAEGSVTFTLRGNLITTYANVCPTRLLHEHIGFFDYIFGAKTYVEEATQYHTVYQCDLKYESEDYPPTVGGFKERLTNYFKGGNYVYLAVVILGFLASCLFLAFFLATNAFVGFSAAPVFGLVVAPLAAVFGGVMSPVLITAIAATACILAPLVLAHAVNRLIENVLVPFGEWVHWKSIQRDPYSGAVKEDASEASFWLNRVGQSLSEGLSGAYAGFNNIVSQVGGRKGEGKQEEQQVLVSGGSDEDEDSFGLDNQ